MGSLKVTLCAGAAVVAAVLTPAASVADAPGGVAVTPSAPTRGAEVALRVSGCPGRTATAASAAFVTDAALVGADGTLTGGTRVRTTLTSGTYEVTVACADRRLRGQVRVGAASARPAPPPASPVAPVLAGGGGTAPLAAADARVDGPGTAHAVTGLLLAGAAAVAVVLRGARRRRGTD
ncbi:hypothetical protein ACIPPJ_22895 [Streptomyces sp. NPDC086091]|uniref:hypothetical protein n=1 Tax=Streptomyces sp. NPDC086091 TaxID=3365751 RepID=UPI0038124976